MSLHKPSDDNQGHQCKQLQQRLAAMLRPNPKGQLGLRFLPDDKFVEQLAWSMTWRASKGTLSADNVADDLGMASRVTLYRNLKDRLGMTYRALERFVLTE